MQKNIFAIIISIIVLGTVIFGGAYTLQNQKQSPIPNTTPVSSGSQTSNSLVEINYTSLEKDRIYTDEEGKYANLNETGKKLLRAVLTPPECVSNPNGNYCDDYEWTTTNSSIVALKDGVLLLDVPNGKGGAYYNVYDLNQKEMLADSASHFGTKIRDDKFVVYVSTNYVNTNNSWVIKNQNLSYYRPGMAKFAPIPLSDIPSTESYWYNGDMGSEVLEISLKNSVLNIAIFNEWKGEIGITIPKKLREVTFALNTLP